MRWRARPRTASISAKAAVIYHCCKPPLAILLNPTQPPHSYPNSLSVLVCSSSVQEGCKCSLGLSSSCICRLTAQRSSQDCQGSIISHSLLFPPIHPAREQRTGIPLSYNCEELKRQWVESDWTFKATYFHSMMRCSFRAFTQWLQSILEMYLLTWGNPFLMQNLCYQRNQF